MAGWIPESQSSIIWLDSHIAYRGYQTDSENGFYCAGGPVDNETEGNSSTRSVRFAIASAAVLTFNSGPT